ncbi:xaa-Pro aminopeptidase 1 [Eurytemora carolleeae]|uniref:xaa-Pro aminopeptidase 1 n=1 Tax=Eurytemora carolleeae TaxID=1294199 RepID=UPI000C788AAE|nr:xaa-Pro aminopeptidase 1 [Eurytemora carolleeae]|eukprot:XP_023332504.1 xaa-Pro aminopeptidase 1-like [Eurytemora affinis]
MIIARLHNVAVRKNCLQTLNTYTRVSLKSAKHLFSGVGFETMFIYRLSSNMRPSSGHNLATLRKLMKDRKYVQEPLAAYIVPSCDAHHSEYLADVDERRRYLSGFTGSAGTAVVTQNQAFLWTDGRYYLQAQQEMDIIKNLEPGSHVGTDRLLVSSTDWKSMAGKLDLAGSQLISVETNLVDLLWTADRETTRPARPTNPVFPLGLEFTGRTWQSKVEEVRKEIKKDRCDGIVLSALDEVAWVLNLRGSDIAFNPVFFSYCVITLKEVVLFLQPSQVNPTVQDALTSGDMEENVFIQDYSKIKDYISGLASCTGKIWFSDTSSHALVNLLPPNKIHSKVTPVANMKAIKNPVELKGFENCHIRDAAALCEYFSWLEKHVKTGQVTEISGADKLEGFRKQQENFVGLSFPSISGSGPNGAIIHYRPSEETNRQLSLDELYLIDSGAQYKDGTTDVTRTLHFGNPTEYEKECFTRVLKGSFNIIVLGLDYAHGTGHGVGSFLNVHEGPMGISYRYNSNDQGLEEGMILSRFGGRNDIIFVEKKFLTFDQLTLVPIQTKLILPGLLTDQETDWLNNYHQTCRDRVGPLLKEMGKVEALDWLIKETQPIG